MIDIVVPQMSEVASEITLVRWVRAPGDRIAKGDPIFELDTDKYVVEIEAFEDGVLVEALVPEGSVVEPGQVVARLEPKAASTESEGRGDPSPPPAVHTDPAPPPPAKAPDPGQRDRILATPKARRVARELGVDIGSLLGTGQGGVVNEADVRAAALTHGSRGVPLSPMRRALGERMQTSKREAPHFYLMVDVDMTQALELRRSSVEALGWDRAPTFTDLIVAACARALRLRPETNIRLENGSLLERSTVDIGIAVDCDDGLRVPVVANADELGLQALSETTRAAAERARQGRLVGSDVVERSMVVSNLGMHGIDAFVAIIDLPDPMILAAGAVTERCVVVDGSPTVRSMCTLTLSADHRVFDGVGAAGFVVAVRGELESALDFAGEAT